MNQPYPNESPRASLEEINRIFFGALSGGRLQLTQTAASGGVISSGSIFTVPTPQPAEGVNSLLIKLNQVFANASTQTALQATT